MRQMHYVPCIVLRLPILFFLVGMPANRGRIKEYLRSLKRRETRALRIPLVPADQRSNLPDLRIESFEAQIAWSEVILLVIKRIIRNVHLAIGTTYAAIGVNHHCGIVIDP